MDTILATHPLSSGSAVACAAHARDRARRCGGALGSRWTAARRAAGEEELR